MKAKKITKEEYDQLAEKDRVIPLSHLKSICKVDSGKETCKYLFLISGENGAPINTCSKKTSLKKTIDEMSILKLLQAKGDHCEGLGDKIKN